MVAKQNYMRLSQKHEEELRDKQREAQYNENPLRNLFRVICSEYTDFVNGKYVDANGLKKVHSVGLIAQNVKEFYPTVVKVGQNGYYYIEYVKLNAVLVEAIKEQQVFIDDISEILSDLENKVESYNG